MQKSLRGPRSGWLVASVAAETLGIATLLCVGACAPPDRAANAKESTQATGAPAEPLFIQYIGNEGFLVRTGAATVLLDALVREGIPPYVRLPDGARRELEKAAPPFDAVDVVLASHFHADHFDPDAVAQFLRAAPRAVFVSTPQAADQVVEQLSESAPGDTAVLRRVHASLPEEGERERLEFENVTVEVLNLHHGRNRNPPVENLGLLVTIDGWRILHIGDTMASLDEIGANDLPADRIDVAFVPYWRLLGDEGEALVSDVLAARYLVVMHVPGSGAGRDYYGRAGTRDAMVTALETRYPSTVILLEPLESTELAND